MDIIKQTRKFLKDNKIDYLLVNSTNEFLVEYAPLEENARYFLTNFSGSTGDAIISQKNIFLFVDGRYHEQADKEVDSKSVTVVKMKLGESFPKLLTEKLSPNKIFAVVSKKISRERLETLKKEFKPKKIKLKSIDFDPVMQIKDEKPKNKNSKLEAVDINIAGFSTKQKFKKISEKLNVNEALLITNLEEVSYLFNLRDFSMNYSSKIKGKCLITKDFCWKCTSNCNIDDYIKQLKDIKKIYVDKTSINAYDYALLGKKAANIKENPVKQMKAVKTNEEIEHYKTCFERTDKALLATKEFIENNENISEFDIAEKLKENFYNHGAKSLSFKSIVAIDKNSALAHYSKNSANEILKEGSLVLIDCGAYYEGGYATDSTRVFVKGKPSKLQKTVYTTVLKGFLKAFNTKIGTKTTGFDIDKITRKLLTENVPEGFEFSHSLGHGIGISVHESPPFLACSPLAKTVLEPNMCFTIEPGLYNPNHFGIRLENSCYLNDENGILKIKSFSDMCFEEKLIDKKLLTKSEKEQLKKFKVQ